MNVVTILLLLLAWTRFNVPLGEDTASGMPGEETQDGRVVLRGGVTTPCDLDVTNKGNGFLTVNGLAIRVVDEHADRTLFRPHTALFSCAPGLRKGQGVLFVAGLLELRSEDARHGPALLPFVRLYAVQDAARPRRLYGSPTPVPDGYWEL